MRQKRRWLVLVVFVVLATAACGDDDDSTVTPALSSNGAGSQGSQASQAAAPTFTAGTTMAELQAEGKIVVGTKYDQPLFGQRDPASGDVEGFDVEIAKIIAEEIFGEGSEDRIEFKETPSRIREDSIVNDEVDIVVATYTINEVRKEKVDFAGPYFVAGQDILVKADDNSVSGVEDLNGKKVCSVQGSTSLTNLQEQAPEADTSLTFETYSLCIEALRDGRVEAVTTDNVILLGFIGQFEDEFKLVGDTFTSEPYGIGLTKGDDEFRDFINDVLEESYEDGRWEAAYESTAGTADPETPEPPAVDRY